MTKPKASSPGAQKSRARKDGSARQTAILNKLKKAGKATHSAKPRDKTKARVKLPKRIVIRKTAGRITIPSPPSFRKLRASPGRVARIVHDADTRILIDTIPVVAPWNALALIAGTVSSEGLSGTGFFIGSQVLLTAGHVLFFEGQAVTNVRLGLAGTGFELSVEVDSSQIHVHRRWKEHGDEAFDVGAIILPADFAVPGKLSVKIARDDEFPDAGLEVIVAGFPGDKPFGELWAAKGPVQVGDAQRLEYLVDTAAGESGGPVIVGKTGGGYSAIGIHNYGGAANSAARFTDELFAEVKSLIP